MLMNYLKLALKVMARRKFFTFISLFGVSLTLVVLMVATAILDNVFAPMKPETRADRTLGVYRVRMSGPGHSRTSDAGYKLLDRYLRGLPGAEMVSVFSSPFPAAVYAGERRFDSFVRRTDGEYWRILEFDFIEGGPLTAADEANAKFVAVIDEETREKVFGGQPAVGKTIDVGGQRFRVIGVVPNVPVTRYAAFADIWVPISTSRSSEYREQLTGGFGGYVLAKSRGDFPALREAFAQRVATIPLDDPKTFNKIEANLDTFFEGMARNIVGGDVANRTLILRSILAIAAILFITLPALNLISINLSRILERAPEIGVRKAFGASAGSLLRQFVAENVVLTVIGGLIGFVLSAVVIALLNRAEVLPDVEFSLNLRVFGYGMLLAIAFGVVSGLWPAWRMARLHPVHALRGGVA